MNLKMKGAVFWLDCCSEKYEGSPKKAEAASRFSGRKRKNNEIQAWTNVHVLENIEIKVDNEGENTKTNEEMYVIANKKQTNKRICQAKLCNSVFYSGIYLTLISKQTKGKVVNWQISISQTRKKGQSG